MSSRWRHLLWGLLGFLVYLLYAVPLTMAAQVYHWSLSTVYFIGFGGAIVMFGTSVWARSMADDRG